MIGQSGYQNEVKKMCWKSMMITSILIMNMD